MRMGVLSYLGDMFVRQQQQQQQPPTCEPCAKKSLTVANRWAPGSREAAEKGRATSRLAVQGARVSGVVCM